MQERIFPNHEGGVMSVVVESEDFTAYKLEHKDSSTEMNSFQIYAVLKLNKLRRLQDRIGKLVVLTNRETRWDNDNGSDVLTTYERLMVGKIVSADEKCLEIQVSNGTEVYDGHKIYRLEGKYKFEYLSEYFSYNYMRTRESISSLSIKGEDILPNFTELFSKRPGIPFY